MAATSQRRARRERGVILFIALVVLVIATLIGLAMMRSATSNLLVAGNVGLKRVMTSAGDLGVERARAWLLANSALLASDNVPGYRLTWDETFDPAAFAWTAASSMDALAQSPGLAAVPAADVPGGVESVRYVIHRLCDQTGAVDATRCVVDSGGPAGSSGRTLNADSVAFQGGSGVLYRVTVRVEGVKGSTSYIQALLY